MPGPWVHQNQLWWADCECWQCSPVNEQHVCKQWPVRVCHQRWPMKRVCYENWAAQHPSMEANHWLSMAAHWSVISTLVRIVHNDPAGWPLLKKRSKDDSDQNDVPLAEFPPQEVRGGRHGPTASGDHIFYISFKKILCFSIFVADKCTSWAMWSCIISKTEEKVQAWHKNKRRMPCFFSF